MGSLLSVCVLYLTFYFLLLNIPLIKFKSKKRTLQSQLTCKITENKNIKKKFNKQFFLLIISFVKISRYVFSAPGKLLDSMPGTLMLTDCLEACQSNDTCSSVNYETGLCVLFSSNADKLPGMCDKSFFFL